MALLDKYNQGGSTLSNLQSLTNPLGITKQSKLHDEYSLNGDPNVEFPNPFLKSKPSPSGLDLNGIAPKGALSDAKYKALNNTFKNGTYKDNLPDGASF